MLKIKSQKGFTLIELLIVIVIIGILAGVLIAIIDPASQQNRARDAGVQASINKVVLATQGFISAYGRAPDGLEFFEGLDNVTLSSLCTADPETECLFDVTGNPLPVFCAAAGDWNTDGAAQCMYHYETPALTGSQFAIVARSFGIASTTFRYDNSVGEMQECDFDGVSNCN